MNSENTASKQFVSTDDRIYALNYPDSIKQGDLVMIERKFFVGASEARVHTQARFKRLFEHRKKKYNQKLGCCKSASELSYSKTLESFGYYQYPILHNGIDINFSRCANSEDLLLPAIFCSIESYEPEYARGKRIAYLINVVCAGENLTRVVGTNRFYRGDTYFTHGIVKAYIDSDNQ